MFSSLGECYNIGKDGVMATLRFIENLKAHRGCLIEILRDVIVSVDRTETDIRQKPCVLLDITHLSLLSGAEGFYQSAVYRTTGKNAQGEAPNFAFSNSAVVYVLVDGSIKEIKVHHTDIRRLTDN